MVRKKSTVKKGGKLPKIVYAQASPKSIGGRSLFDAPLTTESDVEAYMSEDNILRNAVSELQNAGFDVLQVGDCTINIAGPPKLYEEVFKTKLVTDERPVIKEFGKEGKATFIDSTDIDSPGLISTSKGRVSNVIEGVAIEEPVYFFAANAFAPLKNYWHLRVPGDVSLGVNADKAHRGAMTGKGIKVVMTDTGWYRHPYFVQRGYRSSPVVLGPGAASPNTDESGHGTGESANVFAVAPDVDFSMVKMSFTNSIGSFNAAVALSPHIISNSWGSSIRRGPLSARNQALAAAVATAVSRGIIVVFAAGNGQYGFPGQHPDVISAGGVYLEANGNMQASDYASGFASSIYPGRNVPDVSGLVGMRPKAISIMLPVEPGDSIDSLPWNHPSGRGLQGGRFPNGDETTASDGWAAFSGTSAAAPQIAGACALIKQACGRLTPAQVRDILKSTARDVTVGSNAHGNAAGTGPDLATGHGLIDAYRAVMLAKLRCRPIGPIIAPPGPGVVVDPRGPITRKPITPRRPIMRRPAPILPRSPLAEQCGTEEACDKESYISQGELTEEDRAELEQMIIRGEIEI